MNDLVKMGARIHAHTFIPLPQTPFSKASAGRVNEGIRKMIKELIPKGIVYGDWIEQEKIAKKITKYLRTGKLEAKIEKKIFETVQKMAQKKRKYTYRVFKYIVLGCNRHHSVTFVFFWFVRFTYLSSGNIWAYIGIFANLLLSN